MTEWFESRISPEPNTGCWLWTSYLDKYGYAKYQIDGRRGKLRYVTHAALESSGFPRQENACALHRCDNRACVNPDHLYWGTRADNARDMLARGRQRRGFKLSDEDVLAIRSELARGERQAVLAERFGVRDTQISRIATGERHRWAIDPNEWNLAKMRALLSDIEWAGWSEVDGEYCVACERARPAGHAPNCRIAAALASGAGIPKARRN